MVLVWSEYNQAGLEKSTQKWKRRSEETQTLHAGCSKAEPKNFAPPQTPLPGSRDGQNLISWRWSLPLPTNPVWWGLIHAISSHRGNRPTNTPTNTHAHTHTHTHTNPQTGPITIHCATASAQCNNNSEESWDKIDDIRPGKGIVFTLSCYQRSPTGRRLSAYTGVIMRPSSLGGGRILRHTLSVCLSVCPSVCLSVCPSVCLSVCLSVRPSRYCYRASRRAT